MSGGSHFYLYAQAPDELRSLGERIQGMANALRTLGFAATADRTERISMGLFWMEDQARQLADVWQCQEWYDSGDWGRDAIEEAVCELMAPKDLRVPPPACDHMELWIIDAANARCADCSGTVPLKDLKP